MLISAWTAVVGLAPSLKTSAETIDLLRVAGIVSLVVAAVLALASLIRPKLPPTTPDALTTEPDDQGGRSGPGTGDERSTADPSRLGEVVPPLGDRREPAFDEADRAYRDPVVAARLKHVLGPDRRVGRRRSDPLPAPATPRQVPAATRLRLIRGDEEAWVGHTGPEPAPPGHLAARDQEPDTMFSSDLDTASSALGDHGASRPAETIEGTPPSDADLDPLAAAGPQPRSKVVPFIPRQTAVASVPDEVVDAAVVAAITATVRELLFCANVGEYLHGFALYTDRYLFRFMDETGMTVDEFRATFEAAPARDADDWTRLAGLGDARRLDDGRISAAVTYQDGEASGATETYTFAFAADRGLWLIDDIAQA